MGSVIYFFISIQKPLPTSFQHIRCDTQTFSPPKLNTPWSLAVRSSPLLLSAVAFWAGKSGSATLNPMLGSPVWDAHAAMHMSGGPSQERKISRTRLPCKKWEGTSPMPQPHHRPVGCRNRQVGLGSRNRNHARGNEACAPSGAGLRGCLVL